VQRRRLDVCAKHEGETLAPGVGDAVDAYVAEDPLVPEAGYARSSGSMPDLDVPSRDEWDRGYGRRPGRRRRPDRRLSGLRHFDRVRGLDIRTPE
jgi:hypothetical protein